MRTVTSFTDVNIALREIRDVLEALRIRDIDLKGRRVKNASPSLDDSDYVTRKELISIQSGGSDNGVLWNAINQIKLKLIELEARIVLLEWKMDCAELKLTDIYTEQLPVIRTGIDDLVTAVNAIPICSCEGATYSSVVVEEQPMMPDCVEELGEMPPDVRV